MSRSQQRYQVSSFQRHEKEDDGLHVARQYHLGDFCQILTDTDHTVVGQILEIRIGTTGRRARAADPQILVKWFSSAEELGLHRSATEVWLTYQEEWISADSIIGKVLVWPAKDYENLFSSTMRSAPPHGNLFFSHEVVKGPNEERGFGIVESKITSVLDRVDEPLKAALSAFTFIEFWQRQFVKKVFSCLNMRGGIGRVRIDTPIQILEELFSEFDPLAVTKTQIVWAALPLANLEPGEFGAESFRREFPSGAVAVVSQGSSLWRYYKYKELLTFRFAILRTNSEGNDMDTEVLESGCYANQSVRLTTVVVKDSSSQHILGVLENVELLSTFKDVAELIDLNQILSTQVDLEDIFFVFPGALVNARVPMEEVLGQERFCEDMQMPEEGRRYVVCLGNI
eukprot:GILJ01009743.1.p1 GENE.GILJ01009743.1~~GILJ01009743.1.p1  ORF type:complete len:413 (+),score=34.57 GILJ01009743.1:45-1241(+)